MARVVDLRVGGIVVGDDGDLHRVEDCYFCPPCTTWQPLIDLTFRNLRSRAIRSARYTPERVIEEAVLPERELEYLYQSDSAYVLIDPATADEFVVPSWVGEKYFPGLPCNQRVLVGFWGDRARVLPTRGLVLVHLRLPLLSPSCGLLPFRVLSSPCAFRVLSPIAVNVCFPPTL
jgi:translation elongation factor P/translation initiation factor 5A